MTPDQDTALGGVILSNAKNPSFLPSPLVLHPSSHQHGGAMPVRYQAELPARADVVIVGGGAVGAATAFAAARAGLRPLLLERRPALCALTTAAATGAFRLQFEDRDEWSLVRESVDLFLNFAELTGQREYDP